MYDTTTGGLQNAGLAEGSRNSQENVERTREALDDVSTTGPGKARRIARSARRPAPAAGAALLLAGAAATAVLLRRRSAAKRRSGWNRVLPGFLKR